MAKTWVLDTDAKGTGAQMVPLEKVLAGAETGSRPNSLKRPNLPKRPDSPKRLDSPKRPKPVPAPSRRGASKPDPPARVSTAPLPPGHVRKKATGEIGRVRSVDARAGQATVHWLKRGRTSTVPLSAISRS